MSTYTRLGTTFEIIKPFHPFIFSSSFSLLILFMPEQASGENKLVKTKKINLETE